MASSVQKLGPSIPIQCHAWSADKQTIAVSHNDKTVELYSQSAGGWSQTDVLDQHDLRVNDIDWAPNTNRIVTCSADRNAYVWVQGPDGKWKYTLVLLRINRAATCVRWSPQENKFAVGSGARIISICYLEGKNDWWVAKHIRKPIRSTITTVDWHPNNILLAAGCTDFKVRVFSTYIKEIEAKPSATEWGAKMPFNNLMAEFSNSTTGGGWIHAVAFNVDGTRLAWVGHDSSIAVADAPNGMVVMKLKTNFLPFLTLLWIAPDKILAAGHDCVPVVFPVDASGKVSAGGKLEDGTAVEEDPATHSARKIFTTRDKLGTELTNTKLGTTHQNQIQSMRVMDGDKNEATSVSTTAGDGALVIWNLNSLTSILENLKI